MIHPLWRSTAARLLPATMQRETEVRSVLKKVFGDITNMNMNMNMNIGAMSVLRGLAVARSNILGTLSTTLGDV